MSRRPLVVGLAVTTALVATGCTHVQLRKNTVRQARALADLHQQPVVDNLAMFVYDHNALPYFAVPDSASSTLQDAGTGAVGIDWSRLGFAAASLDVNASREATEGWNLNPVNDPRKLELMRCAYQKAVLSCGYGCVASSCPDCQKRWARFYTGDPEGDVAEHTKKHGTVTSECLDNSCCWFRVGCKKCLPKHCTYVGRYCGCCVWVPPGKGRDELSKLTLTILDIAVNEPKKPTPTATKEVVLYLNSMNEKTTSEHAVKKITAELPIRETDTVLLKPYQEQEALRQKQEELRRLQKMRPMALDSEKTKLDNRIQRLEKEIEKVRGEAQRKQTELGEELFRGREPQPIVVPGINYQLFRQRLNTMAPPR